MNTTKLALFEKQLTNMEDALTKSDQKIVTYLKEHPDRFTRMSITDISEDIGTSIAAITRFVKKMGYDKLQDLKLAITRDMEASESSQYVRVEEDDDILTVSKKVLQKNIETIEDIGKIIREDDLEEAFQIIRAARRVIFTGVGGSASVAQDAYHKFMRIGMMVELITDVHTQAVVSSVGNEEDAIIVVSNEGANTELNAALKVAKENRMKIIAITQFSQSPLTKLADVCLYTLSRNFSYKPQSLISRIAEYSLVDVLYVGFCMQSQDTVAEKLLEISTNMKKFKNYND
ncbi:MAG: MurR/RpiR family transcriptional regulator [[Clostridium] innocuum]